jgi:bifunctional non-homologous end joining protein LigD
MLASTGPISDDAQYGFEPKLDGWRAVVHLTVTGMAVYTRTGREVSGLLPELAAMVKAAPTGTVLDGELVSGDGRASTFYALGPLLGSRPERRRSTVTFAAFDVMRIDERLVTADPYEERRRLLEELRLNGPAWCTIPSWRGNTVEDLLAICQQQDVEGLVAKKLGSRYFPGRRRREWCKVKTDDWRSVHAGRRHEGSLTDPARR